MNNVRVELRLPEPADASWIYTLTNDPLWLKFIGDRKVHSLQGARKYIDACQQHFEKWGYGLWTVKHLETGQPLGLCGLINRELFDCPDLGFAFLPEARNQGYAFESVESVIEIARNRFNFSYLTAMTHPENNASQRLLKKHKFMHRGELFMKDQVEQRFFWRSLI